MTTNPLLRTSNNDKLFPHLTELTAILLTGLLLVGCSQGPSSAPPPVALNSNPGPPPGPVGTPIVDEVDNPSDEEYATGLYSLIQLGNENDMLTLSGDVAISLTVDGGTDNDTFNWYGGSVGDTADTLDPSLITDFETVDLSPQSTGGTGTLSLSGTELTDMLLASGNTGAPSSNNSITIGEGVIVMGTIDGGDGKDTFNWHGGTVGDTAEMLDPALLTNFETLDLSPQKQGGAGTLTVTSAQLNAMLSDELAERTTITIGEGVTLSGAINLGSDASGTDIVQDNTFILNGSTVTASISGGPHQDGSLENPTLALFGITKVYGDTFVWLNGTVGTTPGGLEPTLITGFENMNLSPQASGGTGSTSLTGTELAAMLTVAAKNEITLGTGVTLETDAFDLGDLGDAFTLAGGTITVAVMGGSHAGATPQTPSHDVFTWNDGTLLSVAATDLYDSATSQTPIDWAMLTQFESLELISLNDALLTMTGTELSTTIATNTGINEITIGAGVTVNNSDTTGATLDTLALGGAADSFTVLAGGTSTIQVKGGTGTGVSNPADTFTWFGGTIGSNANSLDTTLISQFEKVNLEPKDAAGNDVTFSLSGAELASMMTVTSANTITIGAGVTVTDIDADDTAIAYTLNLGAGADRLTIDGTVNIDIDGGGPALPASCTNGPLPKVPPANPCAASRFDTLTVNSTGTLTGTNTGFETITMKDGASIAGSSLPFETFHVFGSSSTGSSHSVQVAMTGSESFGYAGAELVMQVLGANLSSGLEVDGTIADGMLLTAERLYAATAHSLYMTNAISATAGIGDFVTDDSMGLSCSVASCDLLLYDRAVPSALAVAQAMDTVANIDRNTTDLPWTIHDLGSVKIQVRQLGEQSSSNSQLSWNLSGETHIRSGLQGMETEIRHSTGDWQLSGYGRALHLNVQTQVANLTTLSHALDGIGAGLSARFAAAATGLEMAASWSVDEFWSKSMQVYDQSLPVSISGHSARLNLQAGWRIGSGNLTWLARLQHGLHDRTVSQSQLDGVQVRVDNGLTTQTRAGIAGNYRSGAWLLDWSMDRVDNPDTLSAEVRNTTSHDVIDLVSAGAAVEYRLAAATRLGQHSLLTLGGMHRDTLASNERDWNLQLGLQTRF